jgi:hypothetical protein
LWLSRFRHSRRERTLIHREQTEAKAEAWAGAKERTVGDPEANVRAGARQGAAEEGEWAEAVPDGVGTVKNGLRVRGFSNLT